MLAALREFANDAAAGAGRLVFLGGEAGVGKTTLAGALTAEAPDRFVVRRGACDSLTTAEALGPLVDATPEIADDLGDDSMLSRLRLFRRIQDVLCQSPTLLVLEDVHWADEATLDLLRFLGRRIDRWPLMIVATFRADEVGPTHPLTVVMGDLVTVPGVVRMQLPPLTLDGVRRLVERSRLTDRPTQLHAANWRQSVLRDRGPGGRPPTTCRERCATRSWRATPGCPSRPGVCSVRSPCWPSGSTSI